MKALLWLLVIAAAGYGLYRAYESALREQAPISAGEQEEEIPLVRVAAVRAGTLEKRVFVTGTIEPDLSTKVMPEVAGVLERFRLEEGAVIEEGRAVRQGQVIAEVEHEDLKAALEEARANLRVAKSSHKEALVALRDAEREKKRMVALFEDGTVTEQQRDKALTAYETAAARGDLASERVKLAEANLEKARLRHEDATVEAPMTGVISTKYVDEGSYVNPSTPLVKIINIDHVEMRGGVAGKYFALLEAGRTPARVEVDAYPERAFSGVVDRVQPELDPLTRTAQVTVRVDNPDHRLKPGMFARITIVLQKRDGVPVIEETALVGEKDRPAVFVVNEGVVHRREVRIGLQQGARNEVLEGLSAGDRVVVRGQHMLREGMRVRTEEAERLACRNFQSNGRSPA
jgi:RND family efflux transporter MFP subunit